MLASVLGWSGAGLQDPGSRSKQHLSAQDHPVSRGTWSWGAYVGRAQPIASPLFILSQADYSRGKKATRSDPWGWWGRCHHPRRYQSIQGLSRGV